MALLKGREMVYNAFESKIFSLPSIKLDESSKSDKSSQSEYSSDYKLFIVGKEISKNII